MSRRRKLLVAILALGATDRLHLGERAIGLGARPDPDPRKLPSIRVSLDDFVADKRHFGAVKAELARGMAGLTLNRFTVKHPAFTAEGRGSWLVQGDAASCSLDFEVETLDLKGFVRAMHFGAPVEGEKGHLSARLTWPGAPSASAFERLSGRLELSAANGQLTSVEPGAGRVFGLMNLSHLKRRLALDFDDLTGEGLSFDTLSGTFRLTDGDAYTDNLTLRGAGAGLLGLIVLGSLGYVWIEGWSFFDGLYMTVTTLATVGYGETRPLSQVGRAYTMVLILTGVGFMLYVIGTMARVVVEGEVQKALGKRKLEKRLKKLKDHYIICGFGRIGETVARQLRQAGVPFVVVENRDEAISRLEEMGYHLVAGDATRDEVLLETGIERAKGLVAVVASDADTVFITLSARSLNPGLFIVARGEGPGSRDKLLKAGADRVESPHEMGGRKMAHTLLRPTVVNLNSDNQTPANAETTTHSLTMTGVGHSRSASRACRLPRESETERGVQ